MSKPRNANGRFHGAAWNDPTIVERFKQLWRDGHSASEIAKRLGCFKHCADGGIVAKRNAGLVPRKPRKPKKIAHPWRPAPKPLSPAAQVLKKIKLDGLPLPEPKEIDVARVSVFEAEPHHCRWVATSTETDKHGNPRVFCGEKNEPGLPYCKPHVARAFAPPQTRRPALRVVAGKEVVAA